VKFVETILPKDAETLILLAKGKFASGVRAGGEAIRVRGQDGHFILTSYRIAFVAEVELPTEPEYVEQITVAPKRSRILLNVPLVYLPELQEHPEIYNKWTTQMTFVLETPAGVQDTVYVKATGEYLDFQRTSHDFFKRCFGGTIDFKALTQTGVKHAASQETPIYELVGQRIVQQLATVPESLLQSYQKKVRAGFLAFVTFLSNKGQGGYYDPVARTLALRGGHVHVSTDWAAQSSNAALQQKAQLLVDEWRAEEEAKHERLGERYDITGW
jgi:hypothetical protein